MPWARLERRDGHLEVTVYVHPQNEERLPAADFRRLKRLALQGIERYWSGLTLVDGRERPVRVLAREREEGAIGLDLYLVREGPARISHNAGYVDASVYYNAVSFGGVSSAGDAEFALTAAHEFGHSVLHAAGGQELSWEHKGSSRFEWTTFRFEPEREAPRYPRQGPIDLMLYYRGAAPADVYTRTRAAPEDIRRLVHLAAPEESSRSR